MVEMNVAISEKDYYAVITGIRSADELATVKAIEAGFHPAGYGLFNPHCYAHKNEMGDEEYFVSWNRYKTCN